MALAVLLVTVAETNDEYIRRISSRTRDREAGEEGANARPGDET